MTDFLDLIKEQDKEKVTDNSDRDEVSTTESPLLLPNYPVLAEISIRSTDLHKIANGNCCMMVDGMLGIRFMLKNSFKVKNCNFIINNFVMQIVALGKGNVMTKESIGTLVKLQKVPGKNKISKQKELFPEAKKTIGVREL